MKTSQKTMAAFAIAAVAIAGACGANKTLPSEKDAAQASATAQAMADAGTAAVLASIDAGVSSAQAAIAQAMKGPAPIDESSLDRSVAPCDDFYQFACGGWMKNTPIPADRAGWDSSFSPIAERNEALIKQILEDSSNGKGDKDNPFAQKIGDFYAACMDEERAETVSIATVKEQVKKIDALKNAKEVAQLIARLHLEGSDALFSFGEDQDAKEATLVIGEADQAGLGLPDRDFYLKDEEGRKDTREAYRAYVNDMLVFFGEAKPKAKKDAAEVLEFETALAKASQDRVERRDPYKVYHRVERKGLIELAPAFDWAAYFTALGTPDLTAINVVAPDFFKLGVNGAMGNKKDEKKKLAAMKTYLRWHALMGAAPYMGKKFVDRRFQFQATLTGAKQLLPRWKRCVSATGLVLPEAVGRSYVSHAFGTQSKPMALDMVNRIEAAFEANLATLDWMDEATKTTAKEKLHKVANKIGYPDAWRDYSPIGVDRGTLLQNHWNGAIFENKRQLAKIGKPLDRAEFQMPPQLVNAQYNPQLNDITFPAAILQPPFFSADALAQANYGGIGMVVGHELTHGFDDQGRQYDGDGNLKDWWTQESGAHYDAKSSCVSKQYSGYVAVSTKKADGTLEETHLNGALTLGENIADNGGVKLSYAAFKNLRKEQAPFPYAGFSEDQQFFLGFAQTWCSSLRPEMARLQAQTNEHSTPQWRINGTVANTPEFQAAFACKAGAPMAPVERCQVW